VKPARVIAAAAAGAGLLGAAYAGPVTGAVPGRPGHRPAGPAAGPVRDRHPGPREVVFGVLAAPYLGRQSRAIAEKIQVLDRGSDMVLAAHRTPIRGPLVAVTVETVRFTPPERVDFRLVRGPVPQVTEAFVLTGQDQHTRVDYHGELGTDLWALGQAWATMVAARWEHAVRASLQAVRAEAERRAGT
jgi:hypothetical protein